MTAPQPNSFRTGPDERGHFGIYGGRFVAETLMPLILDLEKAYTAAKADPKFQQEMDGHLTNYVGRPSPLYFAERLTQHCGGAKDLFQARGAQPHRRAQGEQRARPDHAGQAHGQDPHHRRDRRRHAWRRHRHAVRQVRSALHRLHGRGRRRAAEAERAEDEDARGRGSRRRVGFQDAERRHERGAARLGNQRRRHVLLHRHRRRPASLSRHGARFPVRHRPRNPRADAKGRRPAAGFADRLHRRRLQCHGPVPSIPRRARDRNLRRRSGRPRPSQRPARGLHRRRQARRAARQPHLSADERRRPDRGSAFDLRRPGLSRHRAGTCLAQ